MAIGEQETTAFVRDVMTTFAERTGLTGARAPRRYLWTDAFAVCNFLELERRTGEATYRELARRLVDQVHHVLGRHRADDPRTGWISGLGEEEGEKHPTQGGLRIGKGLSERPPGEPIDERLEWDRDGQYFHYLIKWMHALARVGRVAQDPRYLLWAIELAATAYARFTHVAGPSARRRLAWKMRIDLSQPLVEAQGQHDPLDGLVTYVALRQAGKALSAPVPLDLGREIAGLAALCEGQHLATADPLGIGGLLTAAHTLAQLAVAGTCGHADLLGTLLEAALPGVAYQTANREALSMPADDRLAFRELGLSLGLRAAARTRDLVARNPTAFAAVPALRLRFAQLERYAPLLAAIEGFWLDPANRAGETWKEHEDINAVMLATSLAPAGFLAL